MLGLSLAAIHDRSVGTREADVFRLVNDLALPGWTDPVVWLVMQLLGEPARGLGYVSGHSAVAVARARSGRARTAQG